MPREINPAGYKLIKEFEAGPQGNSQPALVPYRCPAGKLTIGWGHTKGVTPDMKITRAQAHKLLDEDLDEAEACVDQVCPGANDNEFSAMVSLAFNIGNGGFKGSTVARMFNAGKKEAAASAFALWRKIQVGGSGPLVDSPGLIRRRNVETALFLTAPDVAAVPAVMSPVPIPAGELMPQAVAPEKPTASSKTVIAGGVSIAAGIASVADQITPIIDSITTVGASAQNLLKLGGVGLSIVALLAVGFMLWRYVEKKLRGEVVST